MTEWGKPFSFKGFGNRFKDWCRAAGLPDCCTLHGVRKHTASWLAEEGATPHQIGSVTGHTSLKEIERYTAKATASGWRPRPSASASSNERSRPAEFLRETEPPLAQSANRNCPTWQKRQCIQRGQVPMALPCGRQPAYWPM
ncbi:tyrosine-type recombinase/integrase [Bradyrhizobium valentinum]|uniref:tyrosine-type recombinase/integrase n=1 Tax=Bradyrhizobium valentinum TaxID=1518501 RepID=UPI0018D224BA